jgi:aspartyl-tRNA(Asn)/glutamyl-tRNA(Gln) amidotransferase subunit A
MSHLSKHLPLGLERELKDPIKMYLADIFTVSVNLAGLPAILSANRKGK